MRQNGCSRERHPRFEVTGARREPGRWFKVAVMLAFLALSAHGEQERLWTLESAINEALANSPDARMAEFRIQSAQAGLEQANAAFMPRFRIESSYAWTDNPMMAFGNILNQGVVSSVFPPGTGFDDVPSVDNFNIHGVVMVPLYTGGQARAGRRAAQANSGAAEQAALVVQNRLAFQVARTFFTVHKAEAFIQATQAAVTAFEKNLDIAQKRYRAGTALKHELLDVEVQLARAREDFARAQNAHELALRTLRNLMGKAEDRINVSDQVPEVAVPTTEDYSGRPEMKAVELHRTAAEANVRRVQGALLPQVGAYGRYDYDQGWEFDGSGQSYAAGVQLHWDLWDGNRTHAKIKEALANLNTAREAERKIKLAIDLEVHQARLSLKEATERLGVTAQVVDQAAESSELTRARFEQGLALAAQVIDAETALTAARVRRAEAESDRRIAVGALRSALGWSQL